MDNFLTSSTLLLYTQLMLKYVTNSVYVRAEKEPIGTFRSGVGLQGNPDKKELHC